jgi:hypothetical protein
MAEDTAEALRQQLFELLLDKVEQDTYPSSTMLDQVERLMSDDEVATYAAVLMSKIDGDTYPSNSLIRRVIALAGA